MIIIGERKFVETGFGDEQEIENVVLANPEHFFGASSVLIAKAKISTADGYGTIPDGYAVDLSDRVWYVVEAELGHHDVWSHISPQVSKQLLAANRPDTGQRLIEILVKMIDTDSEVRAKFAAEGIREIDVRKVLQDIFERPPIVGIPIDAVTDDLVAWVKNLRNDVRLWIVRKFTQLGAPNIVAYELPDESRPVLDTTYRQSVPSSRRSSYGQSSNGNVATSRSTYDVDLRDLILAGLLAAGDELEMEYGPKGGKRRVFRATIQADATVTVGDVPYRSLSYAALACIQQAGSNRRTVNGWASWRTTHGRLLADLRQEYLNSRNNPNPPVMSADRLYS
ncbi:MAG: restriction system modified-DNA reader domain-containing protein [Anaerolineae bacterium]